MHSLSLFVLVHVEDTYSAIRLTMITVNTNSANHRHDSLSPTLDCLRGGRRPCVCRDTANLPSAASRKVHPEISGNWRCIMFRKQSAVNYFNLVSGAAAESFYCCSRSSLAYEALVSSSSTLRKSRFQGDIAKDGLESQCVAAYMRCENQVLISSTSGSTSLQ
ncbi:hypothetical protein LshimejAT787_1201380 [Lyophyllum shimeji]|uniref:Uncharacterized protein n=1 Tax=Lyophyllum shimeji TaxID=47721 RepID=A0A9P3PWB4_LYOSH|nr:hypothetical protein LshimejAT787_1201380 [Lyophyllum shimeji]